MSVLYICITITTNIFVPLSYLFEANTVGMMGIGNYSRLMITLDYCRNKEIMKEQTSQKQEDLLPRIDNFSHILNIQNLC